MRGNGRVGGVRAERFERRDDDLLQHFEDVLARREGELEIELPELELPVGAQILVPPARRDLVVAVEPADHERLLEELGRLGEREEPAGLQAHGYEEVARAFGSTHRHRRRPHVDESLLFHRTANRGDHGGREAQVALHAIAAQVEIAVAKTRRLLDALVVELERQGLRARDDLELVHLDLDLSRRDVRVHGLGCAAHDFAPCVHDELGTDLVRDLRGLGRPLGIDDELDDARVIAQVDEDQPAVVAAARDPPGDVDRLAHALGGHLAGVEIAPGVHPVILSTTVSSGALKSSRPCWRTVAFSPSTRTVHPAPSRAA